jgi:hypothetical protein
VSIAVGAASILSELAFLNHAPFFFHAIIWLSSFAVVFWVYDSEISQYLSGNKGPHEEQCEMVAQFKGIECSLLGCAFLRNSSTSKSLPVFDSARNWPRKSVYVFLD